MIKEFHKRSPKSIPVLLKAERFREQRHRIPALPPRPRGEMGCAEVSNPLWAAAEPRRKEASCVQEMRPRVVDVFPREFPASFTCQRRCRRSKGKSGVGFLRRNVSPKSGKWTKDPDEITVKKYANSSGQGYI